MKDFGIKNLVQSHITVFKIWSDYISNQEIIKGLKMIKYNQASAIQSVAIPLIKDKPHTHVVFKTKNGSGNTCAYLVGALIRIREDLIEPQVVIFCPNEEMTAQVESLCSKICKYTQIKCIDLGKTKKGGKA